MDTKDRIDSKTLYLRNKLGKLGRETEVVHRTKSLKRHNNAMVIKSAKRSNGFPNMRWENSGYNLGPQSK